MCAHLTRERMPCLTSARRGRVGQCRVRGREVRRTVLKTDYGTVVLHWALVATVCVSVATGLRIATLSPDEIPWLRALDFLLPSRRVWTAHLPAGVALYGIAAAYAVYLVRSGLHRRIAVDRLRLIGQSPLRTLNVLLCWVLFVAIGVMLITGAALYLGFGGRVVEIHRWGTWIIVAYLPAHVATHWAIGGTGQLLRIFRPRGLPQAPPPLPTSAPEWDDALALPGMRDQQSLSHETFGGPRPSARRTPGPRPGQHVTLQVNPLAAALAAGLLAVAAVSVVEEMASHQTLVVVRIAPADAPVLDGDTSDAVWRRAPRVAVATSQGANFDGRGTTNIDIRAVHDGTNVYFAFIWDDPTRSLKHVPLLKKPDGWHVLQSGYAKDDETGFHEDKFAVLLTTANVIVPGDRTFHAGKRPAPDKPGSLSGFGLHYTLNGAIVDVWQWKATRGGTLGWMEDGHFGPPVDPTRAEVLGLRPYRGGYAADPGEASYADNFDRNTAGGFDGPVQPKRLPRDWRATWTTMGRVSLDPDDGESEGARWAMTEFESVPYSRETDAAFPVNALIPGVLLLGQPAGDRADVRSAASWSAGRWVLEVARPLDTRSPFDVAIASGVFMRVAAFDHAQIRHTRHIRPVKLEVR